jgi:hypothetical protein
MTKNRLLDIIKINFVNESLDEVAEVIIRRKQIKLLQALMVVGTLLEGLTAQGRRNVTLSFDRTQQQELYTKVSSKRHSRTFR